MACSQKSDAHWRILMGTSVQGLVLEEREGKQIMGQPTQLGLGSRTPSAIIEQNVFHLVTEK